MTLEESHGLVMFMLAAYPGQRAKLTVDDVAGMVAAYGAILGDLSLEEVRAAATRVMRTAKFLPNAAEVREAVVVIDQGARKTGAEAWGEFLHLVGRFGSMRTPVSIGATEVPGDGTTFTVTDGVLLRVIDSLGWRALCLSEDQTADRARFIAAYEAIAERSRKEAQASTGARALPAATGLRPIAELVYASLTPGLVISHDYYDGGNGDLGCGRCGRPSKEHAR